MNTREFKVLLCTNGARESRPGLEFGVRLAESLDVPVHLLGIVERAGMAASVKEMVEETEGWLNKANISFKMETSIGKVEELVPSTALQDYYLTVMGGMGRPLWQQWILGRTFRSLLSELASPLIFVPKLYWPIRQILVCAGGLGYANNLERLSYYLANTTGASITLLHVVVPINLDYPLAHRVQDNWRHLLDTDTPQGRNLREAVRLADKAGLQVQVKVRYGSAVNEILAELHSQPYDLISLGSPYSTHSLRHLYMPNVTADVAEAAQRPILTVRAGYDV